MVSQFAELLKKFDQNLQGSLAPLQRDVRSFKFGFVGESIHRKRPSPSRYACHLSRSERLK